MIVYAGAIVVLFLFVIMLLGVDKQENLEKEPIEGSTADWPQSSSLLALGRRSGLGFEAHWSVGAHSVAGACRGPSGGDVAALGKSVFTTYLFPFEVTSALLVIAVVGAVVLSRARAAGPTRTTTRSTRSPRTVTAKPKPPRRQWNWSPTLPKRRAQLEDDEIEVQDAGVMEKENAS